MVLSPKAHYDRKCNSWKPNDDCKRKPDWIAEPAAEIGVESGVPLAEGVRSPGVDGCCHQLKAVGRKPNADHHRKDE